MSKRHWITLSILCLLISISAYRTLPNWLPIVINASLPEQWLFSFSDDEYQKTRRFEVGTTRKTGFMFDNSTLQSKEFYFHIKRKDGTYCPLLSFKGINLTFTRRGLPTQIDEFILDIACIKIMDETEPSTLTWSELNTYLPPFNITADKVSIVDAGTPLHTQVTSNLKLDWQFDRKNHFMRIIGSKLNLEANMQPSKNSSLPSSPITEVNEPEDSANHFGAFELNITKLNASVTQYGHIAAKGTVAIEDQITNYPKAGDLQAVIDAHVLPEKDISVAVSFDKNKAQVVVKRPDESNLLFLPITFSDEKISVAQGTWSWPYLPQKLQGNLFFSLDGFNNEIKEQQFTGRINLQTEAKRGKSNLVLTIPPINLANITTQMPFQLTGGVNVNNVALSMSVPGFLHLNGEEPEVKIAPGALIRAWGELISDVYIEEARFPLAGISITPSGLNGRLQAILKTREALWGQVDLHMDGKAIDLLPNSGKWYWLAWGNGSMPLLNAQWDMAARGKLSNGTLYINKLTTGLDSMSYGLATVTKPRIELQTPIILRPQYDSLDKAGLFRGQLVLNAQEISFRNGGSIDNPIVDVNLFGESTSNFQFKGDIYSNRFKNIRINGRWDGERLRGQGWWPNQPVHSFRNLFSSDMNLALESGNFYAQASYSAAPEQGFVMGGHLVFDNVDLRYENNHVTGLKFIMPYYLGNHRWHFGKQSPVTLRIEQLKNIIQYQDIQVNLQGYYPFDQDHPLSIKDIRTDLLGGNLSIDEIRFPQIKPALLTIDHIDSNQFWQIINFSEFTMDGYFGGEMELSLNDPNWLIPHGRIENQSDIAMNLNPELIEQIKNDNIAAGAAIDWLSSLQASKFSVQMTLTNLGELMLTSRLKAKNRALSDERLIDLTYTHQENVLTLYRSLTFKNDLHDWLESIFNNLDPANKNGVP